MEKWCFNCRNCVKFKDGLFLCTIAGTFIPNINLGADCDFFRKGRYILDYLHDNDAVDRTKQEDHIDLYYKE